MEDSRFLGPVIKAWFKANDWPQSVSEGLARAKGWTAGPWASQISICMAGRLTPKPAFFVAMGMFNEAIAERDFIGVTDRRLMDRLKAGQPICHDNGVPWNAMDFFGCYIGAVTPPKSLTEKKVELTQEDIDHWVTELRLAFRELVLASMNPEGPRAVWDEVARLAISNGISPEEAEFTQEVIAGLRDLPVEEGKRMIVKHPNKPLIKALQQLTEGVGGNLERLIALDKFRGSLDAKTDFPFDGLPRMRIISE